MDERSIASITKVMTAIVFLESATDLNQEVTIARSDTLRASTTYLRTNDRVRVSDLLHLLLIPSDNAAARALARISPLGADGFIARMNQKADDLGLNQTAYADPSGLLNDNISSAYDMARLIAFASEDDRIGPIMRTPEYSFRTSKGRVVTVRNTNQILRNGRHRRRRRQDRLHQQGWLLPGDATQNARRVVPRWPSSSWAPPRTPAGSGKPATSWRGSPSALACSASAHPSSLQPSNTSKIQRRDAETQRTCVSLGEDLCAFASLR